MTGNQQASAGGAVRFTVLGPVRAWWGDTELDLGSPTRRALLAVLLVHAGQPVVVGELVGALWRGDPPDGAVNIIQRHVGVLRRLVDPTLSTRSAGNLLLRGSGGYRLDVDADMLDLLRFRALAADARWVADRGELAEATELYAQALRLRQGPVAAGIADNTRAHPMFGAVEREYALTVQAAAETALRAGAPERISSVLHSVAAQAPYDEALQARLILVLAASGRQTEAVEVFTEVAARLAGELGIDPGPELRAAHDQVLTLSSAAAQRATDAAPAVVRRRAPAQLPPDLPIFTGRELELAQLAELVLAETTAPDHAPSSRARSDNASADRAPQDTVVTVISGMAGVGKTTLAVRLAHEVAPHFPDGQLYLNMRGFDQAGPVLDAATAIRLFLESQGIAPNQLPPSPTAQADLYRSLLAGRRMLILLDNVRDAEQVRPLLPGSAGSTVIITSRSRLDRLFATAGAHFLPLDVLTPAEARVFLTARIGAARPAAEPQAVEEIIATCGGLPLALAIVAARAVIRPAFQLAAIAEELRAGRGSLDAFTDVDQATDARSVFSWSLRAVSPAAAALFTLLGLHPGPDFSPTAVASLAGQPVRQTRSLLDELGHAHLVVEHLPGRYAQHDLVRTYAAELARAADPAQVRLAKQRMFDHYLLTAAAGLDLMAPYRPRVVLAEPHAGAVIVEFVDHQQAEHWLSTERTVLLAAVEQAARTGFDTQAWQLAVTLDRFLDRQGRRQDQLTAQTTGLASARRSTDRIGIAHALRGLGFAYCRLEEHRVGRDHLMRALELFTELGDAAGQARTYQLLAFQANMLGDHDTALAHYASAQQHYLDMGEDNSQASVINEVGWTHILRGEYELALVHCRRSVDLHVRNGDRNGEAAALDSLGYAHYHLGEYEQAIGCYEQALRLYRLLSDRSLEADTLGHLGDARLALGEPAAAREAVLRAATIFDELGHPDGARIRAKLADIDADVPLAGDV